MEKEDFIFIENVGNIHIKCKYPNWFIDWIDRWLTLDNLENDLSFIQMFGIPYVALYHTCNQRK